MKPWVANIIRHCKIFWIISTNAISSSLYSRYGAIFFITGKILRFLSYVYFLYLLVSHTQTLAGYTVQQIILFFLTFNLIDTGAQFLFRDVYRFRSRVVTGELDGYFIKPLNPLLRSLLGGIDILDLSVLVPLVAVTLWVLPQVSTGPLQTFLYFFLLLNSFVIAAAFHIFVCGFGIVTSEVDHAIFIYRDLTSLGKIPLDVYRYPINIVFGTIIPIGIMMTFPVKALLGLLSPISISISFLVGLLALFLSLRYWRYAVTQYSSASS